MTRSLDGWRTSRSKPAARFGAHALFWVRARMSASVQGNDRTASLDPSPSASGATRGLCGEPSRASWHGSCVRRAVLVPMYGRLRERSSLGLCKR